MPDKESKLAFAKKHSFDINGLDIEITDAVMGDLMTELNKGAAKSYPTEGRESEINEHA